METELTFPKARLDQLSEHARNFDERSFERADAAEHAFLAQQLTIIRPGILETKYAELQADKWVPMNYGFDPGAQTYEIHIGNSTGDVALMTDYETNFRTVDTSLSKKTIPAGTVSACPIGLSFIGWSGGDEALLDLAAALSPHCGITR